MLIELANSRKLIPAARDFSRFCPRLNNSQREHAFEAGKNCVWNSRSNNMARKILSHVGEGDRWFLFSLDCAM
jgi:hypothetical protein